MEKTDRETHDFMNVESFSQLPFIRPAPLPVKEKTASGGGGGGGAIRLFGKEFSNNDNNHNNNDNTDDDYSTNDNANKEISNGDNNNNNSNTMTEISSSSRKFECHYCCRNFPTSQALGGHQNAHKRERQQAKRAHLQSAMVHGAAGLADAAHVYGFMSYGSASASASALPMAYHSRLYGGSYHQPQPINGSPLALWRIPAGGSAQYGSARLGSMHRQLELKQPLTPIGGGNSASQMIRFGYEAKNEMHDHVSLDLHL